MFIFYCSSTFAKNLVLFNKSATFLFVFLYMLAMLRPIAPFVEYAINRDYIAKVLCINKDKPVMKCNGKCHLFKQVAKQQKETPVSLEISFKEYPIGFVKITTLTKKHPFKHNATSYFSYKERNYNTFISTLFRPPIA